jgi:hypothetical protein
MTRRLKFYFTCLIKNIPVLILLKIPHLLHCIRAESLKLKGVDYDSFLSFELISVHCTCLPQAGLKHFEQNHISRTFCGVISIMLILHWKIKDITRWTCNQWIPGSFYLIHKVIGSGFRVQRL